MPSYVRYITTGIFNQGSPYSNSDFRLAIYQDTDLSTKKSTIYVEIQQKINNEWSEMRVGTKGKIELDTNMVGHTTIRYQQLINRGTKHYGGYVYHNQDGTASLTIGGIWKTDETLIPSVYTSVYTIPQTTVVLEPIDLSNPTFSFNVNNVTTNRRTGKMTMPMGCNHNKYETYLTADLYYSNGGYVCNITQNYPFEPRASMILLNFENYVTPGNYYKIVYSVRCNTGAKISGTTALILFKGDVTEFYADYVQLAKSTETPSPTAILSDFVHIYGPNKTIPEIATYQIDTHGLDTNIATINTTTGVITGHNVGSTKIKLTSNDPYHSSYDGLQPVIVNIEVYQSGAYPSFPALSTIQYLDYVLMSNIIIAIRKWQDKLAVTYSSVTWKQITGFGTNGFDTNIRDVKTVLQTTCEAFEQVYGLYTPPHAEPSSYSVIPNTNINNEWKSFIIIWVNWLSTHNADEYQPPTQNEQ